MSGLMSGNVSVTSAAIHLRRSSDAHQIAHILHTPDRQRTDFRDKGGGLRTGRNSRIRLRKFTSRPGRLWPRSAPCRVVRLSALRSA